MSTRAGIIIKDDLGTEIHFYRHSDLVYIYTIDLEKETITIEEI